MSLYKNSNLSQLYFGLKVPVSIMFLLCSYISMFAFFLFQIYISENKDFTSCFLLFIIRENKNKTYNLMLIG